MLRINLGSWQPQKLLSYVGLGAKGINIASVEIHDVETSTDKRGRRLKHLLKLNHATYSILYNHLRFHNHSPHLLGSAYLLGGSADHLNAIYEDIVAHDKLDPWVDSPGEIALHDYRDFLGKKEYQRAWVDFFEDQLIAQGYSWQEVVDKFVFATGPKDSPNHAPMFHCLVAGLGHPLIHLGYAYEINSREIAMEALGLAATCYDPHLASLLTQHVPNPQPATDDLFTVFNRVHEDSRLNSLFKHPGGNNLSTILASSDLTTAILSHFASWSLPTPTTQFSQSQHLASLLLCSTSPKLGGHGYDFFLVHLLTSSHAIRILLPFFPPENHVLMVKEWALITLLIYVAQLTPKLDPSWLNKYDTKGHDWNSVDNKALESSHAMDAHFVKACRAMKAGAYTWGDKDEWFLKCAVRFSSEFDGWGGFGENSEEEEEVMSRQNSKKATTA